MIRDFTFGGGYRDKKLKITAILAIPAEYGREDDEFLIDVTITSMYIPRLREYSFYIMGGERRIYNATDVTELSREGRSTITVLAAFQFRPDFLYSDIRFGFLYEPYSHVKFFGLNH